MRNFRRRIAALAILAIVFTTLSCGSPTSTGPVGALSIKVTDQNSAGIFGVSADLYQAGGLLWRRSLTSSDGTAVFGAADGGVSPGDYYIHLTFNSLYQLAVGETNDRPVTVVAGDNVVVTFHAVPKGPGIP